MVEVRGQSEGGRERRIRERWRGGCRGRERLFPGEEAGHRMRGRGGDGREGGIDGQMKGHSDEVSEVCVCVCVCATGSHSYCGRIVWTSQPFHVKYQGAILCVLLGGALVRTTAKCDQQH